MGITYNGLNSNQTKKYSTSSFHNTDDRKGKVAETKNSYDKSHIYDTLNSVKETSIVKRVMNEEYLHGIIDSINLSRFLLECLSEYLRLLSLLILPLTAK